VIKFGLESREKRQRKPCFRGEGRMGFGFAVISYYIVMYRYTVIK